MTPEQKIIKEWERKFVKDLGGKVEPIFKDPNGDVGPMRVWLSAALKSYRQEIEKPFKHQKVMYQLGRKDALDEVRKGLPEDDKQSMDYDLEYEAQTRGWNSYRQEVLKLLNKLK